MTKHIPDELAIAADRSRFVIAGNTIPPRDPDEDNDEEQEEDDEDDDDDDDEPPAVREPDEE